MDHFGRKARDLPGKRVKVDRAIAEGDLVVLHCHEVWSVGDDYAGIDIFRFDPARRMVEHWGVPQSTAFESRNDNGPF